MKIKKAKVKDTMKYVDVIKTTPTSYIEASKILEAYVKLDEAGIDEIENLLFEYARAGIDNDYLKESLEDYIFHNENWKNRLYEYMTLFKATDEHGREIISKIQFDELIIKAKDYEKKGNLPESHKCYCEANKLRPRDEEIKRRVIETSESEHEESETIPPELKSLVEKLSIIKSNNLLRYRIGAYDYDSIMRGMEDNDGTVVETQTTSYTIGDRIVINIQPDKDGYLTLFHYDDNNLELLFPHSATDNTFVTNTKGKRIGIEAKEPLGKHYLRAIWTYNQIIDSERIDYSDETNILYSVEYFINSLNELSSDEWMDSIVEFRVLERSQ